MTEIVIDSIKDTVKDTITLIPFLFITYVAMEWLERKTEEQSIGLLSRIGTFGHLLGAGIGLIPQCGFSAGAASLYSGGVITAGTLIAVFLSTSDEMLPIFISSSVAPSSIAKILAAKFLIAFVSGIAVDAASHVIRYGFHVDNHIHDLCERDNCGCEEEEGGIIHSALIHTLKITAFIFIISLALSLAVGFAGKDALASLMIGSPVLGTAATAIIGLIPNCAASVLIAQMYLEGLLTSGQLMSGLLVGAGVGLLVLVRTNTHQKENAAVIGVLLGLGIFWGVLIDMLGITF
ncbi:MAG: arsenic efflux protein [Mogibacterium sp.]|nr:arsenic efflux protein [Mogibacterium sp.]